VAALFSLPDGMRNFCTGHHINMFKKMLNATFNNIPVISWRPVLLVEEYSEKTTKMLMLLKRMEERSEYSQVYMYLENVSLVKMKLVAI
jgi:hypothetical protein